MSNDTKCVAMCSVDGCKGGGGDREHCRCRQRPPLSANREPNMWRRNFEFLDLLFSHLPEELKTRSVGGYTCLPYWIIPQGARYQEHVRRIRSASFSRMKAL